MKKKWMIVILAVVCIALVACGVLIGTRLQADRSAPDTRSSPEGDMLTAEEMQQQIDALQKEHQALNEALTLSDQERAKLQEELRDAKSALEASTQEKTAWKDEAEKLNTELAGAQGTIQALNATLDEKAGDAAKMDQMQADNTALQGRIDEMQTALNAANQEKDALTAQLAELQTALDAQQAQNADYQTRADSLTQSLTAAVGEKDALAQRIAALEADIAALEADIAAVNTALENAGSEKQALEQQIASLTEQANSLKADAQQEKDSLTAQIAELTAAQAEQQTRTEAYQAEAAALKASLDQAVAEKAALDQQIAALQSSAEAAAAALEQAKNNTRVMEQRVIVLTQQAKSLKADAQQEKDSLTAQVAELQAALESQTAGPDREALEAQIAALQAEVDSVNSALEQTSAKAQMMENLVEELTGKLESAEANVPAEDASQTALVDQLKALLAEQQTQTEGYEAQAAALTELLAQAGLDKTALDTQTAALEADLAAVSAALENSKNNTRVMESRVILLTKQLNSAKTDAQTERDSLNQQLSELRAALAEQQTQTNVYQAEALALKDSLDAAHQESEAMAERIAALEASVASLEKALTNSKNATTVMENRVIALTQQLNTTKAEAQQTQETLNGQISGLQAELEASGQENDSLRQEIAALQADAEALRGDLAQSRNNTKIMENRVISLNQELNATKAAAQEEQTRLNGRIGELETTLQATEDSLTAKQQENEALTAELTSTNATLAQTQENLATTSATLAETQDTLASTSATLAQTQDTLATTSATLAQTQDTLAQTQDILATTSATLAETQDALADEEDRNSMLLGQLENLAVSVQTPSSFQLVDTEAGEGDQLSTLLNQYLGLETLADTSVRRQGMLPEAAQEEDTSETVLSVNGEAVSRAKVERAVETSLLLRKHLLEQHPEWEGQPSLSLDRTVAARQVITQMAENLALWQKAQSLGLDVMTDAERQDMLDQAIEMQAVTGYSAEELLPSLLVAQTQEKLRDWAAQDVTVADEEFLKELRDRKTATQALYESDPDAFCQLIESGEGYYHYPTAFRRIKQIFLPSDAKAYEQLKSDLTDATKRVSELEYAIFQGGTLDELNQLRQKRDTMKEKLTALQAQWDATAAQSEQTMRQAQEAVADIYARLKAGESFDALVSEYSQDAEMPEGGYVVGDGRKTPFREFVVRALNLPREGSVTKLILADDGYHILYFAQDLANDWNSLRDNKVALWAEMLAEKRQQAADEALAQWIDEADVQVAPSLVSF